MRRSVFLPPVAKIVVAGALHDGLSPCELDVGAETLGEREVQAADQQESKLGPTQLLAELSVPASGDIDVIGILRLCADGVVDSVTLANEVNADAMLSSTCLESFARHHCSPSRR